jgi:hypothetical protein
MPQRFPADSRIKLMTGRDMLKQLAAARGLSERTAKRYLQAGVDINDPAAVEEHKTKLRTRFGVSKNFHRPAGSADGEAYNTDQLEDIIWFVHMTLAPLRLEHPVIAGKLEPILKLTGPVIEKITEKL